MYKVALFRRFLAQDEAGDGGKCVKREQDLVQFYGMKAIRRLIATGEYGEWEADRQIRLHTVDVGTPKSRGVKVRK